MTRARAFRGFVSRPRSSCERRAAGSAEALAWQKVEAAELARLRREVKRLEQENEILKRAAGICCINLFEPQHVVSNYLDVRCILWYSRLIQRIRAGA